MNNNSPSLLDFALRVRLASYLIALILICGEGTLSAFQIKGSVYDPQGTPIPGAMITVAENPQMGPATVTVFADAAGMYRTPELGLGLRPDALSQITSRKPGFKQLRSTTRWTSKDVLRADFTMAATDNVADQVPPSAWVDRLAQPDNRTRELLILNCGDCHAIPNKNVRAAATSFTSLSPPERVAAWRDESEKMTKLMLGFNETEHSSTTARRGQRNVISRSDREAVIAFLAKSLTFDYGHFSAKEREECCRGAALGVLGTVINEYQLPVNDKSWFREVVVPKGSKQVWGLDLFGNKLFRLDPQSGSLKWYDVPGKNPEPHTLLPDANGNIWLTLTGSGQIARFDPRTVQWKIWPAFVDDGGRPMAAHDLAQNSRREVAFDYKGRVWVTMVLQNMLGSLDLTTGERKLYPQLVPESRTPRNAVLYGLAMAADGRHLWWSQLRGNVGSFNAETGQGETVLRLPLGTGPRRMAIDENDVIYVPLYGAGQLLVYDTKARKELARYGLPDRSAAPYAVSWDSTRRVVWVSSMNANKIYRFEPHNKKWIEYDMPRDDARFRVLAFDDDANIWGSYGTVPGVVNRSLMVMMLKPGEPLP